MQAVGSAAGGMGGLAGNIIGQQAAGADRGHAQALTDEAIAAIQGINVPSDLANAINLQQYQNAGTLNPSLEQTINAAPSQAGQVKGDSNLQNAQMSALNALQNLSHTGMSSADRARLNQIQQQAATQAEGQRQSVLQNFAQRGIGGSGNELLAQLQASQNAANQANQQSLGVAGQAQQNALQALSQYGTQAGGMENQQFNQQTQSAQANDLLNRFNIQNQQQQQARNVANQNSTQQMNLQNKQNLMNVNTTQANQELQRQKQAEQQTFQDNLAKGQAMSGANFTGANAYTNMGNQIAQNWSNIGQGVGNVSGGFLSQMGGSSGGGSMPSSPSSYGVGDFSSMDPSTMFAAEGGEVPAYAQGGAVPGSLLYPSLTVGPAPKPQAATPQQSSDPTGGIMSMLPMIAMLASKGGTVPGKAKVPGDSYANDTVNAKLSPHEIVLPRSITLSKNPPEKAKQFVKNIKDKEEC